jgi:hypothetical protein
MAKSKATNTASTAAPGVNESPLPPIPAKRRPGRPKKGTPTLKERGGEAYEAHKATTRERQAAISAAGRDIGPLPAVRDPERRERGRVDPEFFYKTYFPNRFYLAFGKPHRDAIAALSGCSEHGGLFAYAIQRGGGKTALAEVEMIRAMLYGFRRYGLFVAAKDDLAAISVSKMLKEFETNELLFEDFPEVCYPIRRLERIHQRSKGQTLGGRPTRMEISDGHLVLPTIEGSPSSGSIIQSYGLTGAFKGLNVLAPDGTPLRPDFVIVDDAQTRESAKSPRETEYREKLINDDILGLAGPTTSIACVFLCTPIYVNDLSERFTSRERHPEWCGVKSKMVERFPDRMDLWDEYAELLRESYRDGSKGKTAYRFYEQNREAMDAGCVLAWPERMVDGDFSPIQSAMNLHIKNPDGFKNEYQCEPEAVEVSNTTELIIDAISQRFNNVQRLLVPRESTRLTAFIDVGKFIHWYSVVAWDERYSGHVVDYGTWPNQNRSYFSANDPRPTLYDLYPGMSEEAVIYAGLRDVFTRVVGREWSRDGTGEKSKIDRCLVDSGKWPDTVFQAVRQSPQAAALMPSKGMGIGANRKPMNEWERKPGEQTGPGWRISFDTGAGRGRAVLIDTNTWKTFVAQRFTTPPGAAGCLQMFGTKAGTHEMFAEHMCSEYAIETRGYGRKLLEWKIKPDRPDNHWFDTIVGATVAASTLGLRWNVSAAAGGENSPPPPPPPKLKLSDIQKAKRAGR